MLINTTKKEKIRQWARRMGGYCVVYDREESICWGSDIWSENKTVGRSQPRNNPQKELFGQKGVEICSRSRGRPKRQKRRGQGREKDMAPWGCGGPWSLLSYEDGSHFPACMGSYLRIFSRGILWSVLCFRNSLAIVQSGDWAREVWVVVEAGIQ